MKKKKTGRGGRPARQVGVEHWHRGGEGTEKSYEGLKGALEHLWGEGREDRNRNHLWQEDLPPLSSSF